MSDLVKRLRGMASIGWNPIGDEAANEIESLKEKVLRIARGDFMQICSHCGWESSSECITPESQWGQLQKHVRECAAHPMREIETDLTEAEAAVADLMELNDNLTAEVKRLTRHHIDCLCSACIEESRVLNNEHHCNAEEEAYVEGQCCDNCEHEECPQPTNHKIKSLQKQLNAAERREAIALEGWNNDKHLIVKLQFALNHKEG